MMLSWSEQGTRTKLCDSFGLVEGLSGTDGAVSKVSPSPGPAGQIYKTMVSSTSWKRSAQGSRGSWILSYLNTISYVRRTFAEGSLILLME